MTGRLLASDLPRRQPRRVSNFCSLAGGHSFPNSPSNGPAVLTDELPPQGQFFRIPDAADLIGHPFRRREPCGSASLPVERCRILLLSLTQRCKPGSDALRDVSKSLPVIGFHVPEHGEADEQDGAKNLRGFANVCS